jgi:hypothetical protein
MFSEAALAVLERMPFAPTARASFEWLSGGLMWVDEFPPVGTSERQAMSQSGAIGSLLAARAALTLGEKSAFLPVWEQVARQAPNWPGLRPERRGKLALRRLRAGLRLLDRCLAAMEAQEQRESKGQEGEPAAPGDPPPE